MGYSELLVPAEWRSEGFYAFAFCICFHVFDDFESGRGAARDYYLDAQTGRLEYG